MFSRLVKPLISFLAALVLAFAPSARARPVIALHEPPAAAIKNEVRAVVHAADGTLVVGSNALAVFDGARWQAVEATKAYGFRALASGRNNRVWVGAIGAVGYIERDETDQWRFISLLNELAAAGVPAVGDVWSVHPLGEGAVWITDHHALRWTPHPPGGRFDVLHLPSRSHLAAFTTGSTVHLHQEGTGLLRLGADGPPTLVVPDEALPASPVTWMLPDASLIGLQDGAYRWDKNQGFEKLAELSAALEGALPTAAIPLADGRIAIATFNAGIRLATNAGEPLARFSASEGLIDRSVYSLAADGQRLWAATAGGLVSIDGIGHASLFERQAALEGGRPVGVLDHAGRTYVLATSGLFQEQPPTEDSGLGLRTVLWPRAPLTDFVSIGGQLWVAGFGGLWRVAGGELSQEYVVSADVLRVTATSHLPRGVLFLEGYRVKALVPSARGGWIARDLDAAVADSPVSLVEGADGDVWVSTMQQGIVRFGWENSAAPSSPRLTLRAAYRGGIGLPAAAGRSQLVSFGSQLFAFTESGVLALRADKRGFDSVPELAAFIGIAAADATAPGTAAHWLVQSRSLVASGVFSVLRVETGANGALAITEIAVPGLDAVGAASSIDAAGQSLWIGGTRGLLRIDAAAAQPASPPPRPRLVLTGDVEQPNSLDVRFAEPRSASGETYFYQTRLSGVETEWSFPQRESSRTFRGLGPGNYRVEVRVLDRFGRNGPVVSNHFTVPTPWWKTLPAFAAYGALLVLLVVAVTRTQVARLRRQNERLNQLVAERTREIELASTAKSEFLENVSHEIRNPLNGLTGLLAMLKEERLDPQERELARSLKSVAATLTQVFEEVLQFSKLEYGYGRIERCAFALQPMLEEIIALFRVQAQQAGCTLRLVWPGPLVDGFEGDPEKIKTIIVNFVGNALKYAPGAPVELRVEATTETDGMVDLYLDVVDHGPGVPPDEQELIFKKFVRGKRAQDSKIAGTGLGLATCRMLAKMMNGSVGVESTTGRGSTFSLKLLLPRATLALPVRADLAAGAASPGPVLIVDDEPYNRVVLEGIAWELGCLADSAGNAEEALQRFAERDYAIVFLDWELPDGKGGDVARALRARSRAQPPIILATTAHDSDEIRQRCREAGMDGFLLKPYNAAKVRQALAHVAAARATQQPPSPNGDFAADDSSAESKDDLDLSAFEFYSRAQPDQTESAREIYVQAIDAQATIIARAVSAGETETISREAHRLRALSGIVHAVELNRAASRLETVARQGTIHECAGAWAEAKKACDTLKEQLR